MKNAILDNLSLFIFAKDKNLRYLYCSEAFAEVAGLDSPTQIRKKTDYDLYWKKQADFFNSGDKWVLNGGVLVNIPEPQIQPTKIANILTTKILLKNKNDDIMGLVGSYVDITGYTIKKNTGYYDSSDKKLYLDNDQNGGYLTRKEVIIFKYLLLGWRTEKIAAAVCRSVKTIESHIAKIKYKLQCGSKNEIAPRAIELGLTYLLSSIET